MNPTNYIQTDIPSSIKGKISAIVHAPSSRSTSSSTGIIMVAGAGGGIYGPGGIYFTLANMMASNGIAALQVDYRKANHLDNCIQDVLDAISWLGSKYGVQRVLLVGWSFGGAVVISAGALSDKVIGVATVASQTYGTEMVSKLTPKSLLLLHGTGDTCLSDRCSRSLYATAKEPKELILFPGDNHGLTQNSSNAIEKIHSWATKLVAG